MHGENAQRYFKDYWAKRRGLKINMHPISHNPGVNKKYKKYTHKAERRYDKNFIIEEINECDT